MAAAARVIGVIALRSESEKVELARTLAAAAFDDSLAAVAGGAAVIAVMADVVVKIGRLRRARRARHRR
jgi:hypothetical protein